MIVLIMQMLRYAKSQLIHWKDEIIFRYRVMSRGGLCGTSKCITNVDRISIGKNIVIKKGYRIELYTQFYGQQLSPTLEIGDGCNFGYDFTAFVAGRLTIGPSCIFAGNVTLVTENHGINPATSIPYQAQPLDIGEITIGEGCWLGQNVTVLPNVHIGEKVIIASNAVVSHDIPSYSIAAGVPAKVIKKYDFKTGKWIKNDEIYCIGKRE